VINKFLFISNNYITTTLLHATSDTHIVERRTNR